MWGRLSEFVQDKLDSSAVDDEKNTGETVCIFRWYFTAVFYVDIVTCSVSSKKLSIVRVYFKGKCKGYHRKPTESTE